MVGIVVRWAPGGQSSRPTPDVKLIRFVDDLAFDQRVSYFAFELHSGERSVLTLAFEC